MTGVAAPEVKYPLRGLQHKQQDDPIRTNDRLGLRQNRKLPDRDHPDELTVVTAP